MEKEKDCKKYDSIIIGCGFAGAVLARELAERGNQKVLILEQRNHIGGNAYDAEDEYGILIHQYGPHIFHTNESKVYEYLSRFTEWYPYSHEVVGNVYGKIIPIPFNLNTLNVVYGEEKGKILGDKLVAAYGMESRVPILELRNHDDPDIKAIADYVYENIFLKYTMKQWGQTPEQIDPFVTSRVPVLISYDNRYFQDKYQGMPLNGYTTLFEKMLSHDNITVKLNINAKEMIAIAKTDNTISGEEYKKGQVFFQGLPFHGSVIYTGPVDELFDCRYGRLPYRSLEFVFENYKQEFYQSNAVENYTVSEEYTRITEFKRLTNQKNKDCTTIVKEYPMPYSGKDGEIPYYSIHNPENIALYEKYTALLKDSTDFHVLGRLAEYKYYNIDAITMKALELAEKLINRR